MKRHFKIVGFLSLALGFLGQSCDKDKLGLGEDPYAGGKPPLGVVFERLNRPLPGVRPNDVFEVPVRGLLRHEGSVEVFINEEKAQVVSLTDSTMEVRVPEKVASGGMKIKINDQIFFGPRVPIEGNVRVDTDYGVKNGFNSSVNDILPVSNGNEFWILGSFRDFENEASETVFRRSIHKINSLGQSITSPDDLNVQKGLDGVVNSMVQLPDGKYMIGGVFNSMETIKGEKPLEVDYRFELQHITRLSSTGHIDYTVQELINTTPERPENAYDTLPAFNAYLGAIFGRSFGGVTKLFATPDTGVIVVGNFSVHSRIDYTYSSRESKQMVHTMVNNIVRLKVDGRVDSAFGYNNAGANGTVVDAIETNDGKIVVVGNFTRFNNVVANRIVAFNKDGTINTSFNIGSGADDQIFSITYNKTLDKIALAGRFTTFNGQAKPGVVLLHGDGTIDETFTLGDVEQRIPTYAYVMNNGRVLVAGGFNRYNGIHRSGMLILENNGEALQRYNNLGDFTGFINEVVETTSSLGYPALLIGGSFSSVDGKTARNLFKLEIRD